MAQMQHKIDLSSPSFPMLSEQQTRTIIGTSVPGNVAAEASAFAPPKTEVPGIAYCHNVMPTKYGYQSVGFGDVVFPPLMFPGRFFIDVRVIYNLNRQRCYMGLDNAGRIHILYPPFFVWVALPDTIPSTTSPSFTAERVTIGTVNGVSYVYFRGVGCFVFTGAAMNHLPLLGLDETKVLGVVSSSGYLIAYTTSDIAWSSTLLPTDFVPSAITGAGGGKVSDIAGEIMFCAPCTSGVIIYSLANAVGASFTGNSQYPFKLKEIAGSKGGLSLANIAYEANSDDQFVFTKGGLQTINIQRAEAILPEVTDFLAGKRFETYNPLTKEFEYTDLNWLQTSFKHIKFIGSRYLVISYGPYSFTHALIYDTALGKLGKIKLDHKDVLEYTGVQIEISRESIAFLQADGRIRTIDFSTTNASEGVIMLSKLQHIRSRNIELLGLELENIPGDAELEVTAFVSLNGKNTSSKVVGYLKESTEGYREYSFRCTGKNISLVFEGYFNLVTPQITFANAGDR